MDQLEQANIYKAQVKNVRAINTSVNHVRRSINDALCRNDTASVISFTRIYAIVFCTWSEANFLKIIHIPYGFLPDEVDQIKREKRNSIADGWKKCVDLGLRHVDAQRGNFNPNARQKLHLMIDDHVFDPSLIRNKLTHGQWQVALNRKNTKVNNDLTEQINAIDIIKIDYWINGSKLLSDVIECLIESPRKAFMGDWHHFIVDKDTQIKRFKSRSINSHVEIIKNRYERGRNYRSI